jgi:Transposase domain (DUF772)
LASYYSPPGRPSIDPVLMVRMLIVGYVFAIRSERLLCREVELNLAHRWFCGLSIEDKISDHSAFSRARNARFVTAISQTRAPCGQQPGTPPLLFSDRRCTGRAGSSEGVGLPAAHQHGANEHDECGS